MIEQFFVTMAETFGWTTASWFGIAIAVFGILSAIASQLDSMWADEKQPGWVKYVVKFFSRNVGRAANDPEAQS